ncbi:complex I subunit 5 family protein [Thioalkalivibrio sp. ALJ24]|uniref:complex I subunit 5 family protein n=1 Tax=Thioalkalivibrio sp. ALJ24 TaxID=545276 RepID=UPI0003816967|nr:proton-conducting transporter membrane subunit [Thioalkalivibrio sp. ALJ24]
MNAFILLGVPLLPLLLAAALSLRPGRAPLRLVPWAALPALLLAALGPEGKQASLPWLLTGVELGLDPIGRVFLALTAGLWLAAGVHALHERGEDPARRRFFVFFLLSMAGNLGLVLAQDAASFYLFFSLMSLSAWGLVVHKRTAEAWMAARLYLVLSVLGEVALFAGLMLAIHQAGGETTLAAIAAARPEGGAMVLLVLGLGIKAGMLGLHFWLPLAHPAAPIPASAVLSGAMIKAGLLGWMRLLPLDAAGHAVLGEVLVGLGLAAAFLGALAGLLQARPKTILAYSSISQMGLMTTGVGLALLLPAMREPLLFAVALYALHHGLAKGALFLAVDIAGRLPHSPAHRYVVLGLIVLPGLSLAGLPFTSGALAKDLLKAPLTTDSTGPVYTLLTLAAIGTTLLVLRFLWRLRRDLAPAAAPVPTGRWLPWALIAAMSLVLPAMAALTALAAPGVPLPGLADLSLLWPILAGLVLGALGGVMLREWMAHRLPEGDVAVLANTLIHATQGLYARVSPLREIRLHPRLRARLRRAQRVARHDLEWAERHMTRWGRLAVLFGLSLLGLYAAMALMP